MHVPKASVYENNFAMRAEYEVGFAGQVFAMQAVAIAEGMNDPADNEFRRRIFRPYRRHVSRAAQW